MPSSDKAIETEIDMINLNTIFYLSIIAIILQSITLSLFFLTNHKNIENFTVKTSIYNVTASIVLSVIGTVVSKYFKNKKNLSECHKSVTVFVGSFMCLLILWGMAASIPTFMNGDQIVTFYIVELMAVLFFKLHPLFLSASILCSHLLFYIFLNVFIESGRINPYNFFLMAIIAACGAAFNYQRYISHIKQKNSSKLINEALEIIANHDNLTRLQNRYALNQLVPEFFNTDISLAMGDINNFKKINDTYGHDTGDKVLKAFSDILLKYFGHSNVFRYGGDEFLVVIKTNDTDYLKSKLDEMNTEFSQMQIGEIESGLSCCFGCVSGHPEKPDDFSGLLIVADNLLYESKKKINHPKKQPRH